jgi:uncharacterized protein
VSLRGAVSIARRLQDPLAELVKIEPKSIGVGQYQHDVNQLSLRRALDAVVEDCVNSVGVDLNTASAALLARVSGLSTTASLAQNDRGAPRPERPVPLAKALLKVPRLGAKHLRAVRRLPAHPPRRQPARCLGGAPGAYPVVERIAAAQGRSVSEADRQRRALRGLDPCAVHRREASASRRCATSCASWRSPGATRARAFKTARSRRASRN